MIITNKDKSVYGIKDIFHFRTGRKIKKLFVTGKLIIFEIEPLKIYTSNYDEVIEFTDSAQMDYFLEKYEKINHG